MSSAPAMPAVSASCACGRRSGWKRGPPWSISTWGPERGRGRCEPCGFDAPGRRIHPSGEVEQEHVVNVAAAMPHRVQVVEVGPRDGLQNETAILPLDTKQRFVMQLACAGFPVIEAGAFVRPDRVPQMADTAELFRRLALVRGPILAALVPNRQGLERA